VRYTLLDIGMSAMSRRPPTRVGLVGRALGVLAVACAFSVTTAEATILVGLRGDDELVLGTDSKVTGPGPDSRPNICKIHQGRGCFFAIAGPVVGPGFDAVAIARDACSRGRNIDAVADGFLAQAHQPYKAMHDWLLRNESDYVAKRGPLGLAIFIIGRRNGQLVMLYTGYRTRSSLIEPIDRIEVKNGDAKFSLARDLPRFVWLNPNWFQPPYARAAERLVEADMASGWVDVGPPVAVLQVDRTGAKWYKQGLCPPIDATLWSSE
jgi:hypothetical protein